MNALRIGTRGSQLALFQARAVARLLEQEAGVASEIVVIRTSGDRLAEASLAQMGGKRLFVREIEEALLTGAIDLAVHSSKDMPANLPEGLQVGAVLAREDPRDAVILPRPESHANGTARCSVDDLPQAIGSDRRVGTSSLRRSAQLARLLPGARFSPIRGNLDTRLRKLDAGGFDAIVLAVAGLRRLDQADRISVILPVETCVPAPGQGIIAIEIRAADQDVRALVGRLDEPSAAAALTAERTIVLRLGGGCQMPIGAFADVAGDTMTVTAVVVSTDGVREARAQVRGLRSDPQGTGSAAAELLLARGAGDILAEVKRTLAPVEGLQP
jgi:hydroxymethylbilane synthase